MKPIILRTFYGISLVELAQLKEKGFEVRGEINPLTFHTDLEELFEMGWNIMLVHNEEETTLWIDKGRFQQR